MARRFLLFVVRSLQRAMYPFSHIGDAPQRFIVQAERDEDIAS